MKGWNAAGRPAARHPAADSPRPLRIGILAPELSDGHGGMPEYARQLASALARQNAVTLYTMRGSVLTDSAIPHRDLLSRDLGDCVHTLRRERQDVWYACNCALAALSPFLDAPLLAFFNGNDVLNPWIVFRRPWLERLAHERFIWRVAPAIRRRLRDRDMRRGLRAAAGLVANSTNTAAILGRVHPGFERKTVVIPPGVADDFFRPREAPRQGPLRLLTVARLESWTARKNVDGVLQALTLLPPELDVHYTVIGDGDDRARLEALAAELGVSPRVTFRGGVSREALRAAYAEADLFILAARARENDVEGFGIVYLEAAAAGLPVICSAAGGATDAVRDGVSGIVLEDSRPEDIAAGVRRFVAERTRFRPERVRDFADGFRWEGIAARVRTELERAVHDGGGHRHSAAS